MKLFKKLGLMLLMLVMVMVAQAQQSAAVPYEAAIKGDKAAFAQLKTLGNKGHIVAQFALGFMYERGEGVPKDSAQAVAWYRKSAEQGDDNAQFFLGRMYRDGIGVPKDLLISYMWLNLAAAQGHEVANEMREMLEKSMTAAQIDEGQRLCREWKPGLNGIKLKYPLPN